MPDANSVPRVGVVAVLCSYEGSSVGYVENLGIVMNIQILRGE